MWEESIMKKSILILTILSLTMLLPVVSAIDIEVNPLIDRIPPMGIATYNFTFYNPNPESVSVTWSLGPNQAANWITSPSATTIPPESTKEVTFTVIPKSVVLPSQYNLLLQFRYQGLSQDVQVPIRVVSVDSVFGFQPHVTMSIEHRRELDPREPYTVRVVIRNQNPRNLEGLVVTVDGELFREEFVVDVGPSAEVSRDLQFTINPLQAPGQHRLSARVSYPLIDALLYDLTSNFEVITYSDITPVFESETSWFKTTETITLQNRGNVQRSKEVALRAPWYQRIFLSSDVDYELVQINGKANMAWNPSLAPDETMQITVIRNYRPLAFLLFLALLVVLSYFVFRSPLIVQKHAFVVKQVEEGVNDIKIRLYIRNRSNKSLYNINVSDMLPRITEFVESKSVGSIKPTKITKTSKKGTILNWHFDVLEGLEERIITYKIRSTLRIVGDITLPNSRVKFENSEGKESFANSSSAKFYIKQ